MSKQIYVQAQADFIESLGKGSPISAIEELVWNALDASAREVRIELLTNQLGGVDAIRISDDGTGINVLDADATFGSLGGSWKRKALAQRALHGRHGCGRFKAFSLGSIVEWRTTMRAGNDLLSYVIRGEAQNPGIFQIDNAKQGPGTGTEVFITQTSQTCASLLSASETVQALASKFALYLKSYPDVNIYFNGIPITPIIVQKSATNYTLTLENGARAKMEVIEWKSKFVGAGKLVFAGLDGFQIYEQAANIRSNGVPFTAYLVSERFPVLNAENALVMSELHPETRAYIHAARAQLKAHFKSQIDESLDAFKKEWKARLSSFTDLEKKTLLSLLKKVVK